jgi:WD40 repeat protein
MRLVPRSGAPYTVQERFLVDGAQLSVSGTRALAYNPFGAYLIDVRAGGYSKVFSRPDTRAAALSRDGTVAATGHAAKVVRVWDTATGAREQKLFTYVGDIEAVAFSPRHDLVASANSKGIAQVWRVADGTVVAILGGHTQGLTDVGFSEDARHLVTASRDGTIRVSDVGKSTSTAVLSGSNGSVTSAAFVGDGKILSASGDEARLWDARPDSAQHLPGSLDKLVALADRRLAATGRTLTLAERKRYLR